MNVTRLTTVQLTAVGALAMLRIILSLPGFAFAAITGVPYAQGFVNAPVIGIMYPLVPLLIRRVGAVTLWALIMNILAIPLPLIGPPGFLPKVIVGVAYGLVAEAAYIIFRRNLKVAAIAIGAVSFGTSPPLEFYMWSVLGVPGLANAVKWALSPAWIAIGLLAGGFFGWLAYVIYKKVENTAVVRRIQGN